MSSSKRTPNLTYGQSSGWKVEKHDSQFVSKLVMPLRLAMERRKAIIYDKIHIQRKKKFGSKERYSV